VERSSKKSEVLLEKQEPKGLIENRKSNDSLFVANINSESAYYFEFAMDHQVVDLCCPNDVEQCNDVEHCI